MNRDLFLVLKSEWYNMIEALIKKDEYRDLSKYWIKRLLMDVEIAHKTDIQGLDDYDGLQRHIVLNSGHVNYSFIDFDTVTFQRGYNAKNGRMRFECKGIEIRTGNPKWGAVPGEKYFCIALGDRLFDSGFMSDLNQKGYRRGSIVHYVPEFQPITDTLPGNFELSADGKEIISYCYPKAERTCFDKQGFYTVYDKRDGWVKLVS